MFFILYVTESKYVLDNDQSSSSSVTVKMNFLIHIIKKYRFKFSYPKHYVYVWEYDRVNVTVAYFPLYSMLMDMCLWSYSFELFVN